MVCDDELFQNNLKFLEILVFDEADRLIDQEYNDDLSKILEKLPK